MHPAYSVILFTTASGAGYGLLALLGITGFNHGQASSIAFALTAMIAALGLKREQVYIANVLKCRPPNNRDPQPDEVEQCESHLIRQIELIQPKLIVALGRHAAHSLLKTDLALARLRGQPHHYQNIPLVVTYHPAYLLRTPSDKRKAWEDLCRARIILKEATTP